MGLLVCSCTDADRISEPAPPGLVAGLLSDLVPGGDFAALEFDIEVDGEIVDTQRWSYGQEEFAFPSEVPFPEASAGVPVAIQLRVYNLKGLQFPFMDRRAETQVPDDGVKLLRVRLEQECIPNIMLPGDTVAPTCDYPETCIGARCTSPFVAPPQLESYSEDWHQRFADACKSLDVTSPTVELGAGRTSFEKMSSDASAPTTLTIEYGEQGGYHVWLAVRADGLHQAGSITTISGDIPSLGVSFSPVQYTYGLEPSGGQCELVGLRYPLVWSEQQALDDIDKLLGVPLVLTATVHDVEGDTAVATADCLLAP